MNKIGENFGLYRIYLDLTKEQSIEGKNGVVNQIKDTTVANG